MFAFPHPTIRDANRRELYVPTSLRIIRDIVDPRSFPETVAPREHPDTDIGEFAFGDARRGGGSELRENPDPGVGAGFEGVAALDWLGIGWDWAVDVDTALLGDGEDVGYGNWDDRHSDRQSAGGEEGSEEEGFSEHF